MHCKTSVTVAVVVAFQVLLLTTYCIPCTSKKETPVQKVTLLDKIKEKKHLNVVILNSPNTYYTDNTGKTGFEYTLISEFAKSIDVDLNLTIVTTISEALQKSREGVGDITVAGLTLTKKREDEFKFGPQYATVQEQLICSSELYKTKKFPRSFEDMANLNIMVGKDTSYESTLNDIQTQVNDFNFTTTSDLSTEQLLGLTQERKIDCTVSDSTIFMTNQRYYPKLVKALVLSQRKNLTWIIRPGDESLNEALYKWLNTFDRSGKMDELQEHYFTFLSIFDYYDTSIFYDRLKTRLPKYKKYFMGAGEKYNIPWIILAAVSYQESYWNPKATSRTGVRGLMMLTNKTAKWMGVKNRLNPKESIYGGAKYLRTIEKQLPPEIKGLNRWYFTLASYNVGYGHILDAQILARKLNKNPYSWIDIKEVLPLLTHRRYFKDLKYGYARGEEPVKYADSIHTYYDIIIKHEEQETKKRMINEKQKMVQERIAQARQKAHDYNRKANKGKTNLKVIIKRKLWVGYINIDTKKKHQTVTKKTLTIDQNKDWLLLFGPGHITLEINHEIKKYSSSKNMRFKYVNGKFKKISVAEFKYLNRGKKW
ncbi:MAG: membrane-bound lytic murein transglycosylase MltF [Sulfurimonas sp.]